MIKTAALVEHTGDPEQDFETRLVNLLSKINRKEEIKEMLKYHSLRDKIFSLKNLYSAFKKVKKNKGKAGLDSVSIKQFEADLDRNILNIHKELKSAIYIPCLC